MRLSLLLSVSLLLAGQAAHAQSADDFFNLGAQAYISNNIPQALGAVQAGLKHHPDDVKLKKLYELLKQQQQSQNNQSQQNQQPQNQQPSQTNSQPQKQNEQKQSDQKNSGQPNQPQPQKSDEPQGGGKPENQNGQGQPQAAGQMTPAEARRMLDAQKGDEQFLQLKPQGKPQNQQQPIKDW
jgi:Ca-activated chloride channel family protein